MGGSGGGAKYVEENRGDEREWGRKQRRKKWMRKMKECGIKTKRGKWLREDGND